MFFEFLLISLNLKAHSSLVTADIMKNHEGHLSLKENDQIVLVSRPWQSQRLLYKHLCDSLIHSLIHPLVKISLWRRHAQTVNNGASSYKTNYIDIFLKRNSKSQRASKLHCWFKSYANLAEWVDFAYWWSFIRK